MTLDAVLILYAMALFARRRSIEAHLAHIPLGGGSLFAVDRTA